MSPKADPNDTWDSVIIGPVLVLVGILLSIGQALSIYGGGAQGGVDPAGFRLADLCIAFPAAVQVLWAGPLAVWAAATDRKRALAGIVVAVGLVGLLNVWWYAALADVMGSPS